MCTPGFLLPLSVLDPSRGPGLWGEISLGGLLGRFPRGPLGRAPGKGNPNQGPERERGPENPGAPKERKRSPKGNSRVNFPRGPGLFPQPKGFEGPPGFALKGPQPKAPQREGEREKRFPLLPTPPEELGGPTRNPKERFFGAQGKRAPPPRGKPFPPPVPEKLGPLRNWPAPPRVSPAPPGNFPFPTAWAPPGEGRPGKLTRKRGGKTPKAPTKALTRASAERRDRGPAEWNGPQPTQAPDPPPEAQFPPAGRQVEHRTGGEGDERDPHPRRQEEQRQRRGRGWRSAHRPPRT